MGPPCGRSNRNSKSHVAFVGMYLLILLEGFETECFANKAGCMGPSDKNGSRSTAFWSSLATVLSSRCTVIAKRGACGYLTQATGHETYLEVHG